MVYCDLDPRMNLLQSRSEELTVQRERWSEKSQLQPLHAASEGLLWVHGTCPPTAAYQWTPPLVDKQAALSFLHHRCAWEVTIVFVTSCTCVKISLKYVLRGGSVRSQDIRVLNKTHPDSFTTEGSFSTSIYSVFLCPPVHQLLPFFSLLTFVPLRSIAHFLIVLICTSFITDESEHLFTYLLAFEFPLLCFVTFPVCGGGSGCYLLLLCRHFSYPVGFRSLVTYRCCKRPLSLPSCCEFLQLYILFPFASLYKDK